MKITRASIKKNIKLIDGGKPLTIPLALLGQDFKEKYRNAHHTDKERETLRWANKKRYYKKKSKKELKKIKNKLCASLRDLERRRVKMLRNLKAINDLQIT